MKRGTKVKKHDDRWDIPSGRVRKKRGGLEGALRGRRVWRSGGSTRLSSSDFGGLEPNAREAVVTVRYTDLTRPNAYALAARHERYLQLDGKAEDGGVPNFYNREWDEMDPRLGVPLKEERRLFRLVISPADGHLLDLTDYVRKVMAEIESDCGQKLIWSAVNHYNTAKPHAHVVVRGVDEKGKEIRFEPDLVKHGMRMRARQVATRELGLRTEQDMLQHYEVESKQVRTTALDHLIARRLDEQGRYVQPELKRPDLLREAAIEWRLSTLTALQLARKENDQWIVQEDFRSALREMQLRREALRRVREHTCVRPERTVLVNRSELVKEDDDMENPSDPRTVAFQKGVQGVVRWKGLDQDGKYAIIVESIGGEAYHLPVSERAMSHLWEGKAVDLRRAVDRDAEIEAIAKPRGGVFDIESFGKEAERYERKYGARMEQLERMGLAKPIESKKLAWQLVPDLVKQARSARGQLGGTQAAEAEQLKQAAPEIDKTAKANGGVFDLEALGQDIPQAKALYADRLQHLQKLKLAQPIEGRPQAWKLVPDLPNKLEQALSKQAEQEVPKPDRVKEQDPRIEATAKANGGVFDLEAVGKKEGDKAQKAYGARLRQLQKMQLARQVAGRPLAWKVEPELVQQLKEYNPQLYWHRLSMRGVEQKFEHQIKYTGWVWLDEVSAGRLGSTGFGAEVAELKRQREAFIREIGLTPGHKSLRWELQELQRRKLLESIGQQTGRRVEEPRHFGPGKLHVHRAPNGQRFAVVSTHVRVTAVPAPYGAEKLEGKRVELERDDKGRWKVHDVERRREEQAKKDQDQEVER